MRRDPLGKLFLFALVIALAGLAAVTRFPDSWLVHRVARAAVIGPWVERLAELYRQPPAPAEETDLEGGVEVIYRIASRRGQVLPTILVEEGSTLFAEASEQSTRLASLPATSVELFDRKGDWYEVEYDDLRGWVFVPEYREPLAGQPPPLGSEPAPPLPLPSRPPDPEVLASATELLADSKGPDKLGPYRLYTDEENRGLLIFLSAVAAQLESVYVSRYDVEPLPGAREAVVLFASEASYLRFLEAASEVPQVSVPGMLRAGVVATYSEGRGWSEVAGTLIHELTHLLNKRALGPALPPWLEEGLADDLAQSRIEGLRIFPGTLGGSSVRTGTRTEYKGGQAAVIELGRAVSEGELQALRSLVGLDWEAFQRDERRFLRYGHSSFFVRSLLDSPEPGLATAFRGFLRDVSEGRPATAEALLNRLGRSWENLDSRLVAFVRTQADEAGLPVPAASGSSSRQASEPSS
ncbi:MAG: hypothetical protein GY769_08440 [bacterium]|nr:hypothetical protein [bacterium]